MISAWAITGRIKRLKSNNNVFIEPPSWFMVAFHSHGEIEDPHAYIVLMNERQLLEKSSHDIAYKNLVMKIETYREDYILLPQSTTVLPWEDVVEQ
jgi:hypothetical protein